ncbi:MAG: hypothetical protein COT17_05405 [Elusimicrobia bacterium CG08_land_8_20_14_0_20_51_18]|nr:MAG: hypothetical protein COT17_05405 [Elusimicrobia bacterium CG08_land_8_20_14_0_20_51_18]
MEIFLRRAKIAFFFLFFAQAASALELNMAVLDPYQGSPCGFDEKVYSEIALWLDGAANIRLPVKMKKISLKDELSLYPILLLSCSRPPADPDFEEIVKLRKYFSSGGNLLINDSSGEMDSAFSLWAEKLNGTVFNSEMKPLRSDEPLFKSFFIINRPFGRYFFSAVPKGTEFEGRKASLFFKNDIYSVWRKDGNGKYLYKCVPGGEAQREMSRRVLLNAVMYFLTGDYKSDAVHQPLIMDRIRKIDSQLMEY